MIPPPVPDVRTHPQSWSYRPTPLHPKTQRDKKEHSNPHARLRGPLAARTQRYSSIRRSARWYSSFLAEYGHCIHGQQQFLPDLLTATYCESPLCPHVAVGARFNFRSSSRGRVGGGGRHLRISSESLVCECGGPATGVMHRQTSTTWCCIKHISSLHKCSRTKIN